MIIIHDVEQGSDEWLKLREPLYTGSGADKLLGNGFNQMKIVDGKLSPYALAGLSGFKGNYWTKRGHILEDEAVELYSQVRRVEVSRPGMITNTDYPGCGYSPDGMPPIPLLEVKCFNEPNHRKLLKGDIPIKILAQIHFGLMITDKPYAELLAYNPELDVSDAFKIIQIKRNEKIINNFRRRLGFEHLVKENYADAIKTQ